MAPRKKERRPPVPGTAPSPGRGSLRAFSWAFAAVLFAALCWAVVSLSQPDANARGAAVHVTQRYLERGPAETGFSSPAAAVFLDYRGYDLWTLVILFFISSVLGLLPRLAEGHPPHLSPAARASLFFSFLGFLAALGLGFYTLQGGANFLDYEPLTAFCRSSCARVTGGWMLNGAFFLAGLGSVLALVDQGRGWKGGKRGS